MKWEEIIIWAGAAVALVLLGDNIRRHIRQYRESGIWMKVFILYIELIKAIGGTFLTLLWIATSLFLYEGVIDYFGGKGVIVAVIMILPICFVFYGLLNGFTKLMDAFPAMMHENNSNHHD